jgi:hypothetical protein
MDTESGEESKEILILENGDTLRLKDTEFTLGKTGIDMKENGNSV